MQAERELADLAGCEEAFAAVRQRRLAALRAAGLPQSQLLARLEEQLDRESQWLQALAAMGSQGQDALEQAKYTLTLAAKLELSRPIFLVQTLQDAADLTIQQQQALLAQTEQLTAQVADALMTYLKPKGSMVVIEAEHMCMTMRGIKKPGARTMTYVCRGVFEDNPALCDRVFAMIR